MTPNLRLIYFDFPFWRAEPSRIALFMGNIPYEDHRPSREEFLRMKRSGELPYGQLPVLDVDGVRIAQSVAIARYCGKVSGLYPAQEVATARCDELLDTASQITQELGPSMRSKDPVEKARLRQNLATKIFPRWMGMLEQRLQANGESGFFVGDSITMADLIIWRLLGWLISGILDGIPTDLLDPFPGLLQHQERIGSHPGVLAWKRHRQDA